MNKIAAVVFDLGGVLLDWNPRYLFKDFFPQAESLEFFLKEIDFEKWNDELDKGVDRKAVIESVIRQFPRHRKPLEAFANRWLETIKGEIKDSLKILEELKAKKSLQLFAITNYEQDAFEWTRQRYSFLNNSFASIVVSGEEKVAKPDPRIFQIAIERFKIDPSTAIFIDDRKENVDAAQKIGFQIHHFQSPQGLRKFLFDLNLLP